MKIGIDIRCLQQHPWTGIAWHTYYLLEAMFQIQTKHEFVLFSNQFTSNNHELFANLSKMKSSVVLKKTHWPNKLLHASLFFTRRPFLDTFISGCDLFFFPNLHFHAISPSCKVVSMIHDMSFMTLPHMYSWHARLWHACVRPRRLFIRSDVILCVSEFTKWHLTQTFPGMEKKCYIVSPGYSESDMASNDDVSTSKSFFLAVATIEARKNMISIVEAYEQMDTNMPLIMIGKLGYKGKDVLKRIAKSSKKNSILYKGYVNQEEKTQLMKSAFALIYPSYFEGYGMPIKEAMRLNTPVICSDVTSLPSVGQEHALYVNPYNVGDITLANMLMAYHKKNVIKQTVAQKQEQRDHYREKAKMVLQIFESI